jgi:hypothetical protein
MAFAIGERVASSPSTFVLLPSLDVETCVGEIVRRQLLRRFARTAQREEQAIRERFSAYVDLPACEVETMQPVAAVVSKLLAALAAQQPASRDGIGPRFTPSFRRVQVPVPTTLLDRLGGRRLLS